ncbi:type II toxin-antitoxin system prevent-host-death family antitoxin [Microcoleus sp. D2_18a_D3]|uniref:type II toxin-antitoxin system prevent-host-death family antitoxin n=1 Tax=Microcoleus sp. D2_18a_D3 TaxID=3055330 RepID=UPI002FD3B4D5
MYLNKWKITIAINETQQQLQQSIAPMSQSLQPIAIAGQTSNTVLLSESDSASVEETLYLLSVAGMRESIREGLATPIEDCDRPLDW